MPIWGPPQNGSTWNKSPHDDIPPSYQTHRSWRLELFSRQTGPKCCVSHVNSCEQCIATCLPSYRAGVTDLCPALFPNAQCFLQSSASTALILTEIVVIDNLRDRQFILRSMTLAQKVCVPGRFTLVGSLSLKQGSVGHYVRWSVAAQLSTSDLSHQPVLVATCCLFGKSVTLY